MVGATEEGVKGCEGEKLCDDEEKLVGESRERGGGGRRGWGGRADAEDAEKLAVEVRHLGEGCWE